MCHNRPSAALLTPYGFGQIRGYAPFSLSALHLSYSYKLKRVCQNSHFDTPSLTFRRICFRRLVLVKVYALERYYNETLNLRVKILTYSHLAIAVELLLHKSGVLEELVETTLSNVLDHLLGK